MLCCAVLCVREVEARLEDVQLQDDKTRVKQVRELSGGIACNAIGVLLSHFMHILCTTDKLSNTPLKCTFLAEMYMHQITLPKNPPSLRRRNFFYTVLFYERFIVA